MDLLYALAAFVLLLTYATIAVAVGAIIAEQLRDRCDSSHVYCWHDVNGYFFGAFWPLIFSALLVAWLATVGPIDWGRRLATIPDRRSRRREALRQRIAALERDVLGPTDGRTPA